MALLSILILCYDNLKSCNLFKRLQLFLIRGIYFVKFAWVIFYSNMAKPILLLTGCTGLLGQKLLATLPPSLPYTVVAISKNSPQVPLPPHVIYCQLDLTHTAVVEELFENLRPALVLHTAALTLPDKCEQNQEEAYLQNVTVVELLCRLANLHRSFFVQLSTDFVFDGTAMLLTEEANPNPINYYGQTKYLAEEIVKNTPISWAIVRTCLVFGVLAQPSRSNILLWVIRNLQAGNPINVVADQLRTPTLAEDLAKGCWQVVLAKAIGVWHIAGNDLMSPYQFALKVAEIFELDSTLISPTNAQEFKEIATRPLHTGFNTNKAQELLHFTPMPIEEALRFCKQMIESTQ
jgi:dTDP-4-dehydrorhamnose reductase